MKTICCKQVTRSDYLLRHVKIAHRVDWECNRGAMDHLGAMVGDECSSNASELNR